MDIKQIIKKQIENGLIHPNDGATKEGFEMGYKYAKSEQLLIHSVVVPKGTLCECGNIKPHRDQSHCQKYIDEAFIL